MTRFIAGIHVQPGFDDRDQPGGRCSPLGLVFELVGPAATIRWTINTGWLLRPVVTETLRVGPQLRSDRPGVDPHLATEFPEALPVRITGAEQPYGAQGREVEGYGQLLMEALFRGGSDEVFAIMKELHALA